MDISSGPDTAPLSQFGRPPFSFGALAMAEGERKKKVIRKGMLSSTAGVTAAGSGDGGARKRSRHRRAIVACICRYMVACHPAQCYYRVGQNLVDYF